VYDNPNGTRRAIMSIARKNGKSAMVSCLLLAHIVGPMAVRNSQIASCALSRDQAAIVFRHASNMITMNATLSKICRVVPSGKKIIGIPMNTEYRALAADSSTAMGASPAMLVFDETGQVKSSGRGADFLSAMMTSQGAYENPLQIFISTQAPSDADPFSQLIDDAVLSKDPKTVVHVYSADKDADLLDEDQWRKANPALGLFRSESDLREQMLQASRLPSFEHEAKNLLLNQRVALEGLAFAPQIVSENNGASSWEAFRENPVHLALDLSRINDLTAACFCCFDGEKVHVKTFAFTPLGGIEERATRNKIPLVEWADRELIYAVAGDTLDYQTVCQYLMMVMQEHGIVLETIQFDDWNIQNFRHAADAVGFAPYVKWVEVRQGFKSISPRIQELETALLQRKLLLDNHPVLNMGMAAAIVMSDPAGNRKIKKPKDFGPKVDAVIALLMGVYPCVYQEESLGDDIAFWVA
jgi:phage terminase large subunit-like protein